MGAIFSAAGPILGGIEANNAAQFNAKVATQNAIVSNEQSADEAALQQRRAYQALGAERAAYGASGVTTEGSPLAVLASSASAAELDRQTVLYKGRLKAQGLLAEASADRVQGQSALIGGVFSGIAAGVDSASKTLMATGGA